MRNENSAGKFESKGQLRAVTPSTAADEPLALLDFGDLAFLVSSKDIFTLISTQKMATSSLSQVCGEIVIEERKVPVFAINKALQLNTERPANHLTLVVLQHETQLFGFSCVTFEKIDLHDLNFFQVPVSMSSRKQPFSQFAVVNNRAAGLTSSADLLRMLETRGVIFPESIEHHSVQEAS